MFGIGVLRIPRYGEPRLGFALLKGRQSGQDAAAAAAKSRPQAFETGLF